MESSITHCAVQCAQTKLLLAFQIAIDGTRLSAEADSWRVWRHTALLLTVVESLPPRLLAVPLPSSFATWPSTIVPL